MCCHRTRSLTELAGEETHVQHYKYLKQLIFEQQLYSGDFREQKHCMPRHIAWAPAGLEVARRELCH